ncbi:MAG: pentapeptide repeat-containing protein [Planctomycetota bacterium]
MHNQPFGMRGPGICLAGAAVAALLLSMGVAQGQIYSYVDGSLISDSVPEPGEYITCDLLQADLVNADLMGAMFVADWYSPGPSTLDAHLMGANLSDACFGRPLEDTWPVYVSSSDMTGAIIDRANFTLSDLTIGQLTTTQTWQNGDLSGIHFPAVDFSGLDLRTKTLTDTDFTGANFTNANLANMDLAGAYFHDGTMLNADLTTGTQWLGLFRPGPSRHQHLPQLRNWHEFRECGSDGCLSGGYQLPECEFSRSGPGRCESF